jgi:NAD-dependent DNA ligase
MDKIENIINKINSLKIKQIESYLETIDKETLFKVKDHLDDLYYNTGEYSMDDNRYDILKDYLPKQNKVGSKLREGENRVTLPYWLGSADKITPNQPEVLERWLKENKTKTYIITEKLDGVSCLLSYTNSKIKLYTRGDGIIGADISYLASFFDLPELKEDITVRGELIIKKEIFDKKYKGKKVNNREYKNSRNMVSGLIGSKTTRIGLEDIDFIPYEIVEDVGEKPEKQLDKICKLGFKCIKYAKVDKLSIKILEEYFIKFKIESEYELDGIIVNANEKYDRNISGNPDYMFAFKMMSENDVKETKVLLIEWNISKWGQLKPVAILEPIILNDITISRATAHNAKYIVENNLGKGSVIKVVRSKEVIPYIVEVVSGTSPDLPNTEYIWDKNKVNILTKKSDNIMCVKLLSDFFSKLGIKFVSEATVDKLYKNGLNNLMKIISADKQRLLQVPEFQEKSAERIYTNIREGLKNVKLSKLLGASGILGYGIGERRIEALFLNIPNFLEIIDNKSKKEMYDLIINVEGFSDITTEKIIKNLKYVNIFLEKLKPYTTFKKEIRISSDMKGNKFVVSGFRDKKLEEDINQRGGKLTTSVSGNTTGIIVVSKGGKLTGKVEKASQLGIPIYTKEEFKKKYNIE